MASLKYPAVMVLCVVCFGALGCETGVRVHFILRGFDTPEPFQTAVTIAGYDNTSGVGSEPQTLCYTDQSFPFSIGIHPGEEYDRHSIVRVHVRSDTHMPDQPREFFGERIVGFSTDDIVEVRLNISQTCLSLGCTQQNQLCSLRPPPECSENETSIFPLDATELAECLE